MKNHILYQVLIAILLAIVAGSLTGTEATVFGIPWISLYDLIGQLFLNALSLVVVPLVVSSIITGSARIGQEQEFGKLGKSTFFYFIFTSFLAVLLGMVLALLIAPGKMIDAEALRNIVGNEAIIKFEQQASGGIFEKLSQILYRVIPSNIFAVASQGQMLGMILFSILFGFFSSRIDSDLSDTITRFWKGTFQVMMKITGLIMKALPFGVFGLMAKVAATTGIEAIKPVFVFFCCVIAGLFLFMFLVLPLLLLFVGVNPISHFRAVTPALVTAFSTSSSAATLPVTIECMEKRANIPNRFCSFILPLGTAINLSGSALYTVTAVIFIAQAYGIDLNLATLTTIVVMGVFAGLGMVAGIPSASMITIVVILQTIGLPPDGIVLTLAVERVLDMFRTAVNVFTNTCCASLVYSR